MARWSVSEAKARFSELLAESRKSPQIIERRGHPVAVVVAPEEMARLQRLSLEQAPSSHRWAELLRLSADLRAAGGAALAPTRRRARPSPFEA
jgi:prevent-host-death family protein